MATSYPGGIDSFATNVAFVDLVSAADMNNVQDATVAIQTELGTNPRAISDTSTPPASPAGSVAAVLDMFAYQLRRLIDNTDWKTTPGATVGALVGRPYITNGADAVLTNETAIGTVINAGPLGSRPAAAPANAGWLWFVTSGGASGAPNLSMARSDGVNWVNVGFSPYGTLAHGDIVYWDDVNKQWIKLPIGGSGQVLGVASGAPAYITPGGIMVASPSVFDPATQVWASYSTIQSAINNATSGQVVMAPDAVYNETITLKDGVLVYMPGSTIQSSATSPTVTGADGGLLVAGVIRNTKANGRCVSHSSGTARIVAREIVCEPTGAHTDGICIDVGAGTLYVTADRIAAVTTYLLSQAVAVRLSSSSGVVHVTAREVSAVSGGTTLSNTMGLYVISSGGVIHARCGSISASGAMGDINAAVRTHLYGTVHLYGCVLNGQDYDIYNNGATVNVHGCQYDPRKVYGLAGALRGDRGERWATDLFNAAQFT